MQNHFLLSQKLYGEIVFKIHDRILIEVNGKVSTQVEDRMGPSRRLNHQISDQLRRDVRAQIWGKVEGMYENEF